MKGADTVPSFDARCAWHEGVSAVAGCGRCGAFVCAACVSGHLDWCVACAARDPELDRLALARVKGPSLAVGFAGAVGLVLAGCLLFLLRQGLDGPPDASMPFGGAGTALVARTNGAVLLAWLVIALVTLAGAVTMRRLRRWPLAIVAAALVMLPCGGLCLFGFPIGGIG